MKRTSLIHRISSALVALAGLSAVAVVGCADTPEGLKPQPSPAGGDNPTIDIAEQPSPYSGGEDNTHDHFNDLGANGARDPFDILAQRQEEGPPEIRTRLHSCQKLQNSTISSLLSALGVDMNATGDPAPAGQLFKEGTGALGAANYDARVGETIVWTSAGAAKLFDIFVQAAGEIITNIETVPQCQLNGVGPKMFNDQNQCNEDAVTCIMGAPATPEHIAICSSIVQSASDLDKGKRIAVATLLSAAFSCE